MSSRRIPVYAISFPENVPASVTLNSKSKTLVYLTRILYSSGAFLTVIYILALFILKPLLEKQYALRGEYLNHVFGKLNGFFTSVTRKLNVVPAVAVKYNDTLYYDAMVQTEDTEESAELEGNIPVVRGQRQDLRSIKAARDVKEVRFADEVNHTKNSTDIGPKELTDLTLSSSSRLQNTVSSFKDTLKKLKVSNYKEGNVAGTLNMNSQDISEMRPLMFQMKQFQNYLEMVSSTHPRDTLFKRKIGYGLAQRRPGQTQNILDDLRTAAKECYDIIQEKRVGSN